jgi:hypothetical protein
MASGARRLRRDEASAGNRLADLELTALSTNGNLVAN